MKKYVYIALGASLLVACTAIKEEPVTIPSSPEEVSFGAYLNRSTTKAGAVGELSTSGLQTAGFGVFGYHTDNALYSQAALPNFMYNTKVSGTPWQYSPIKYWPNEYGENASSEAIDRLTFFAYAPYVAVNSSTGALSGAEDPSDASTSHSTGITRLSRATDTGDPMVSYVVSFDPAKTVDLTWGVAKTAFTNSAGTTEGTNSIAANTPYINVARPSAGKTIDFNFQHALAALNVTVNAAVTGEALKPSQTKIYVRSVSFEGFAGEGSLNLNSTVDAGPQWQNYFGNGALSTESVTIYDGLRDGREATSTDANEKPANLNENIIQSTPYGASPKDGVTATAVNLFNSATLTAPVYVIPTGDNLKVTIAYDVETIDDKIMGTYLADGVKHGSVVENKITKAITGIGPLEAGKKYVVALHLGLNSVDFDADITGWDDGDESDVDLPFNSFVVNFTQGGTPVTAPMALWVGGSATRTATTDFAGSGYSLSGDYTYSSSNPSVAEVNSNSGEVTAIAPGEATITATGIATKASAEIAGSYKVIVNSVSVSSSKSIVYAGDDNAVKLSVTPVDEATYEWAIASGGEYLSLADGSTSSTVTLHGLAAGTATVTCTINGVAFDPITVAVAPDAYTVGGLFGTAPNQFYFAKGNLRAQVSTWAGGTYFKYAESIVDWDIYSLQSDFSPTWYHDNLEWVEYFCWAPSPLPSANTYGIIEETYNAPYSGESLTDWGEEAGKYPKLGGSSINNSLSWRTPTSVDWDAAISNCYFTSINGHNGLVLSPDSSIAVLNSYSYETWKLAELQGLVFLPLAGNRVRGTTWLDSISEVGEIGNYWSGTWTTNNDSNILSVDTSTAEVVSIYRPSRGCCIRLIHP